MELDMLWPDGYLPGLHDTRCVVVFGAVPAPFGEEIRFGREGEPRGRCYGPRGIDSVFCLLHVLNPVRNSAHYIESTSSEILFSRGGLMGLTDDAFFTLGRAALTTTGSQGPRRPNYASGPPHEAPAVPRVPPASAPTRGWQEYSRASDRGSSACHTR